MEASLVHDPEALERFRKKQAEKVGTHDSRVFWSVLYATPVIWALAIVL